MPAPRPGRFLDLTVGACIGGAVVAAGLFALHPVGRVVAARDFDARPGAAAQGDGSSDSLPLVVPDSAPADAPLRRELRRLATVQAAWYGREGYYAASAASLAYWPAAAATISFDVDTAGESWAASAYDPYSRRQCAIRVGPAPEPYFNPLADGVVACRTLPDTAEFTLWGRSPTTTVWVDGVGHAVREGSPVLRRLRTMQLAWIGDEEEDDGSDFLLFRDGQARVPYPDGPGRRWASQDGYVRLADALWGNVGADGRWVAVIRLVETTGGTALDGYLAVVRARAGRLVNGPPYYIGDRTKLLRLRAARGVVTADLVVRGAHDPRCCPTDTLEARFAIQGDSLVETDEPVEYRLTSGASARAIPARRSRALLP